MVSGVFWRSWDVLLIIREMTVQDLSLSCLQKSVSQSHVTFSSKHILAISNE